MMCAAAMGKARGDEAYFQRSSLFWVTIIILSFGYYTWVIFWPESIPYQSLGPLGPFTQYLLKHHHTLVHAWYWLAWMIHVGESLYAIVLCNPGVYKSVKQTINIETSWTCVAITVVIWEKHLCAVWMRKGQACWKQPWRANRLTPQKYQQQVEFGRTRKDQ
ncbi:transmembrane protein 254 isoform X3 [Bos javanicus]|uniref:transmembrane protein 254 isoform X3 n=1 Tax=Bos javanicus TaxID=9906 RepID=UPI002AA6F4C2|nr:transmembrane protein 254 isoform X3 [Bos javanicus]